MGHKVFKVSSTNPYHVTARCINRDWFSTSIDHIWKIMSLYLFFVHHAFKVKIHSFVLMPNHFHLLISCPKQNLSEAMAYFMRETSRCITRDSNRINRTYGARFHRSEIQSFHYFMHAYKYVYRNPVKANLSEHVETYPYSTLHGLLGYTHLLIPTEDDSLLFSETEETLSWLNREPETKNHKYIQKALKKTTFRLSRTTSSRKNPLETDLF